MVREKKREQDLLHISNRQDERESDRYGKYSRDVDEKDVYALIEKAKKRKYRYLDLSNFRLKEIPREIGDLTNLEILILDNFPAILNKSNADRNIFKTLPKEIGHLKNLRVLNAYSCDLESLPNELAELKNLKELGLNNNKFKEFPEVICKLTSLERLAINKDYNCLPDSICNLTNLREFYLPEANIDRLPEKIGNLNKLELLCIWGTAIKWMPESLKELTNITDLYLTKSFCKEVVPPEILKQAPYDVLMYIIRQQYDHNKIKLNESKMIIVGQGGVGKTCLLNRLIKNEYEPKNSTDGIDIEQWLFTKQGESYRLNVWDFGGQEIYHATHQFFLTNRSLYIFVWDAVQEEEYGRIDYWLNTIESYANDSPILIVVNKCDRRKSIKHLDLKSLKDRFPQIINSVAVSCKDNININQLEEIIQEETTHLPLMGITWLSSWLSVRQELEGLAKINNTISYSEYLTICIENNISKAEAMSLSQYLHDLGIILHFHKDLFLKDVIILNPEWGTKAVYNVLDAQDNILKNRNGILSIEDLPNIWRDESIYPNNSYPIILRLMENFQLLFEISKNGTYLIAELLENDEIILDEDFTKMKPLNFQYVYSFMPSGIMTRFIVKSHTYLVERDGKKVCWKKGAYLGHKSAIAVVKLYDSIKDRKVDINVYGKNARDKKELLGIIRAYFSEIHNSIPKLKYEEKIKCICSPDCNYLHDYQYLLHLEEKKIEYERCRESLENVSVIKLIDGIDLNKKERKKDHEAMINQINFKPTIEINSNLENNAINQNVNIITIEIKNLFNEMQGSVNELIEEVSGLDDSLTNDIDKIKKSIANIDDFKTKEDVVKSGVLNRIRRFLEEIQDTETSVSKTIKSIKHGISIAQDIADKYNRIAEWCCLPTVPRILLK